MELPQLRNWFSFPSSWKPLRQRTMDNPNYLIKDEKFLTKLLPLYSTCCSYLCFLFHASFCNYLINSFVAPGSCLGTGDTAYLGNPSPSNWTTILRLLTFQKSAITCKVTVTCQKEPRGDGGGTCVHG